MTRFAASIFLLIALIASLTSPRTAHAAESYDNCTGFITSIPAVISTQGIWCFKQDLSTAITTGAAITIATNNVTIDCNDFKLGGLAAGLGTSADGIYAANRLNATVRHCNIRGFLLGLDFTSSGSGGGHVVEDNRFDGNTIIGLRVQGDGSVVRRNRVFDTGQSTIANNAYGLVTRNSVDVLDNTVSGVMAPTGSGGYALGIDVENSPNGRVIGNGVSGLVKDGAAAAYGIYALNSSIRIVIRDNDLVGDTSGVGIYCTNATSRTKGNVISAFATGITDCSDDGGNVVSP